MKKILVFAGSIRTGALSARLAGHVARELSLMNAESTLISLADYEMPIYNGDLEKDEGVPENAKKLKGMMLAHQGIYIASPEYNSSITPLLKNTIDWASRPVPGEPPLACFGGKVAVVMSASPGALGGLRGLVTLRSILGNIGTLVLTETYSISRAMDAFDPAGALKDPGQQAVVEQLGTALTEMLRRLQTVR